MHFQLRSLTFEIEHSGVITESGEIILLEGMQMSGDHLLGGKADCAKNKHFQAVRKWAESICGPVFFTENHYYAHHTEITVQFFCSL